MKPTIKQLKEKYANTTSGKGVYSMLDTSYKMGLNRDNSYLRIDNKNDLDSKWTIYYNERSTMLNKAKEQIANILNVDVKRITVEQLNQIDPFEKYITVSDVPVKDKSIIGKDWYLASLLKNDNVIKKYYTILQVSYNIYDNNTADFTIIITDKEEA